MSSNIYMPLIMIAMIIAGAGNTLGQIFYLGGKWQDKFNVLDQDF